MNFPNFDQLSSFFSSEVSVFVTAFIYTYMCICICSFICICNYIRIWRMERMGLQWRTSAAKWSWASVSTRSTAPSRYFSQILMFWSYFSRWQWSAAPHWQSQTRRGAHRTLSSECESQKSAQILNTSPLGPLDFVLRALFVAEVFCDWRTDWGGGGILRVDCILGPKGQLARFAAGCYIEMATSSH